MSLYLFVSESCQKCNEFMFVTLTSEPELCKLVRTHSNCSLRKQWFRSMQFGEKFCCTKRYWKIPMNRYAYNPIADIGLRFSAIKLYKMYKVGKNR